MRKIRNNFHTFCSFPRPILKFTLTRTSAAFAIVLEGNGRDTYLVNAHVGMEERKRRIYRGYIARMKRRETKRVGPPMSSRAHLSALPVEVQKVAPPSPRTRVPFAPPGTLRSWISSFLVHNRAGPPDPHQGYQSASLSRAVSRARIHAHGRTRAPTRS